MTTKTFTPAEIRQLITDLRQEHIISAREWGEEDHSKISTAASRGADALEYLLQFVEWKPTSALGDIDPDGEVLSYTPGEKYRFHRLRMRQGKPFIIGDCFAFDRKSPSHILPFPPPPEEKKECEA
jgi:hypothetical protein